MDKVIRNKRGLELVNSPSSGQETSSEKFLYLLYIIWASLMMQYKAVWVVRKITSANLCNSNHDIKLFHFHLSFWIWRVWKGIKSQKCEYRENEKSFSDEIKNIFQFLKGYHLVKKKFDKK